MKKEKTRLYLNIPKEWLKVIDEYKEEENIRTGMNYTRNGLIIELIRQVIPGLNEEKDRELDTFITQIILKERWRETLEDQVKFNGYKFGGETTLPQYLSAKIIENTPEILEIEKEIKEEYVKNKEEEL